MTDAPHPLGPMAPLAEYAQFIVVLLVPEPNGKTKKLPLNYATGSHCNAHEPLNWTTYDVARSTAQRLGTGHTVGFVLTSQDPWVCIDIDNARQADGSWSPLANQLAAALPGSVAEISQSGNGLHLWCKYPNPPAHRQRRIDLSVELYSETGRFICLGTNQTGTLAERCDALPPLIAHMFPPIVTDVVTVPDEGPRADWRGPPDDDELIRRMRRSRSAGAVFGSRASFDDLWTGNADPLGRAYPADPGSTEPYDRSSADAALAQHLAFWTGCDVARCERLMRRSALARPKWDDRPDYLVARTIMGACSRQVDVLHDRQPEAPPPPVVLSSTDDARSAIAADEAITVDRIIGEDSLALAYAERHQSTHRWSPGVGWMVNTGPVWQRDEALTRFTAARELCRAAASYTTKDAERRALQSAKTVNGLLTLAQSDKRLAVPTDAWDADPLVLNTPLGAIDLRTGAAVDRSGHYLTHCAAVTPDFVAAPSLFLRFMDEVFLGDRDLIGFLQRLLGYCITGDRREQILAFWHGIGANGKSTLLDLVQWMLGSYALKLPASTLMTTRGGEQHPTGIAQLRGKRLAVSSELDEAQHFNEPLVKELTGDDVLTARFMRGDFFSFKQSQKHLIVGNYRPRLRGGDPAIARRLLLVPFDAVFGPERRDPEMPAKLRAEAPAILAWLIRGAIHWHTEGLGIPERVRAASADYMAAHDDLQLWLDERCERTGEAKASDLYSDFRMWKERRGEHAPTMTTWGERLQRVPGITRRRSDGWRYAPIRIKLPTPGAA